MDTLAIRISDDGASPTLELSVRLPAGAQMAGFPGHPAAPAISAAPPAPATAGVLTALKGTLAVQIDGQKPTPASLVPLRAGPAEAPAIVPAAGTAVRSG